MIEHLQSLPENWPLTKSQLGIYLECINNPDAVTYNIPSSCTLPRTIDKARFINAVKTVVSKHPALSANFDTIKGVPSMFIKDKIHEVKEETSSSLETFLKEFVRPFQIDKDDLCRLVYLTTPDRDYFVFDIHHLIFDGTSTGLFLEQISDVYAGKTNLPEEELSLADIAFYEQLPKNEEDVQKYQSYFDEKFSDIDGDSAPVDDQVEKDLPHEIQCIKLPFGDRISHEQISNYVKSHGISENAFFLGAFGYTLAKFNGTNSCCFSTGYTGRIDKRLRNTIGMFVQTLPMTCHFDENDSPEILLKEIYNDYYITKQNHVFSYGELSKQYGFNLDVSFVFQATLLSDYVIEGENLEFLLQMDNICIAPFEFMLLKNEQGYVVDCHYFTEKYTADFVQGFLDSYVEVVCGILSANKLSDISLVSKKAETQIHSFNETDVPYDTTKTVVTLFREQVKKTPDQVCLVYENKQFTYSEVDAITDRIAQYLRSLGVQKNTVTGVLIPRCEYMLLCSLGVLKAGGAYMPLDQSYPPERLNLMMQDSGAILLISTPELSTIITEDFSGKRIMLEDFEKSVDQTISLSDPSPDDLFIVLYTSGSTGTPKGVLFAHSNIMVTSAWERRFYEFGPGCNNTAYASYGFDANAFDMYPTITSGATLHIISDEIRLDLLALQKYYNEQHITHSTMTTQVGRQFAMMGGSESLRFLSVAGEKLTPLDPPKGFKLFNLYGPTEGSILASGFLVDKLYRDIPIGKAIDNVKLYVVDAQGHLLPPGAVGELWISGAHVTQGYLNRPEKTKEAYGENPFISVPGYERVYRTGDTVRLLSDGNIQFIGRRDGQVKVRGFRVELTEVEEVIRRFDGIKDATVAAFDEPSGGKFIAAYIVADSEIDISALNNFIREEKPPYMVPAVTMQIDSIPLNQNQKVNKKALPKPERKVENIVLPQNDTQQKIYDIVKDILGHSSFGIDSSLYDAGLTSIGALKLNVELGTTFDKPIKLDDIKKNDTVQKLESLLNSCAASTQYEIMNDYPITETQKGIFIEWSMNPHSVTYNIPVMFKLSPNLNLASFIEAVKTALHAHPYIKTTLFSDKNGDIRARRNEEKDIDVNIVSCKSVPSVEELVIPFDLLDSPLYRITIYKAADGNYFFMEFHHIIADGTSEAILISDINKAYAGETIPTETYSGFEIALDEEVARKSDRLQEAKAYYDSVFLGCDTDCLPPKSPESEENGAASYNVICDVPATTVADYCSKNKLTENAFFNAAFGFTLSRFCQYNDVVYTTVYNGRNDSRLSSTFSMLVKTLPVMVRTETDRPILDFVKETQTQLMNSMSNDIYSFAEISNAYGIRSDIIFVYQGDSFTFDCIGGEPAEFLPVQPDVAKAPISINVYLRNNRFEIESSYRKDMYSEPFMKEFLGAFVAVVQSSLSATKLSEISTMSKEAEKILSNINQQSFEFENIPAHRFFERFAASQPDCTAVIATNGTLTYRELNEKANQLAHGLRSLGVKTGDVVGLMLDRTVELPLVELAILKAGGAFLGLLPSYPDDRVNFCLEDAQSPVLITTEEIKESKPSLFENANSYRVVTVSELLKYTNTSNLDLDIPATSLAYCIYTSGSTGKPKGVMIQHHNLANFKYFDNNVYSFYAGKDSGQVGLAFSSISFDMSIFDNLVFLLNGKTVCIATDSDIHNPAALGKLMLDNHVTSFSATPSLIVNYLGIDEFRDALAQLSCLVAGAEAFPSSLYNSLRVINPNMHIINGYGPSECTITCSAKLLQGPDKITIGKPVPNTEFYVLDAFGNLLPPYGFGELIIGGDLVGSGYINLPEKTKASFFTLNGRRAYHSGDTVRFNADGEIEFFGRIDNQVKLRGFRVELDEIEKCICSFPHISQSKVIVRNNGNEDYLAGFFTASQKIEVSELTDFLKTKLTYYMVPDVIAQLDAMPLTPNGKIDKKAFPEIKKESKKSKKRAPKKSLEQELCELFQSVLSLDEYYADDNFFEMGGTSLSASKVTMQLMSKGIKIEYQDIFDNPTPEMLGEYIESITISKKVAEEQEEHVENEDILNMLKYNTLNHAAEVKREPLGDVLLTGAVGFLGIHILKELIDAKEGKILCLVRKGDSASSEIRLKNMLMYYFGDVFTEAFENQIVVFNADITNDDLPELLSDYHFDTIINCAACVKHYASDNSIEIINVHGVENLIRAAKQTNARLIQISTTSVPGVHTDETYSRRLKMHENELFVVDDMDNKYCISKYHAELKMLEAIKAGMRGKIIRVGNLMGRHSDGEFQINFNTNAFLHALRGFATIGKCPISHATDPMSFSPIDMTAKAIVLLAGTNDQFTAFHADSRWGFDEMQLIEATNKCGITITPVPDDEYYADYYRMLGDEKVNARLSGLVTNDRPDLHMVETSNDFTANILYRLGFSWPLVEPAYLERAIESLISLDYFGEDDIFEIED